MTVALFTIPQAMAYALIAGFPPSVGITTALVAAILGAAFGSSEFLVNGPTNAISVVLVRALFWLEPRTGRRLPAPFMTVLVVSVVAYLAPGAGLKLVKELQPIARELPHFVMPVLNFPDIFGPLATALAISVIGSVEAIAIGKLLAARVGHPFSASRHRRVPSRGRRSFSILAP